MSGKSQGPWAAIRRVAASDRISGLIMLGFALMGLILANIPATAAWFEHLSHFELGIPGTNIMMGVGHWAQDGLLTIFFLVVGLELKQELTTGSLSNVRAAAVPMLCAVCGMIVPPSLLLAVVALFSRYGAGDPGSLLIANGATFPFSEAAHGWAIPTATDIAFSLAVRALFAKALPGSIRAFLMTLATVDDLLAIILIAVFFSSLNAWYWFVGIAVCAVAWYFLVRMRKVPWFGVAVIGVLSWVMMYEAGVHPTLAGVLVGLLTPARAMYGERDARAERYADKLQPFSALLALPI
ncbi:MAG: Na+/H+ antiporter NhaA, partial [Bifidobacterium castoris]|nr:Na+/H+ antiporter NhaA [Bifidobacterium castoris]